MLSLLYGPTLTSVRDYWKNHSFDYMDLCQQRTDTAIVTFFRFIVASYVFFILLSTSMYLTQFSSVAQLCLTLCDPMDCSMPGFPIHHQLPELTQTHVHQVTDAIQPSYPLSSPFPPAFNLSQHLKTQYSTQVRCLIS